MLKSDSHHPKKWGIKFLPLYFGQIEKTAWFER